jgi:two-component system response regulator DctR
MVGTIDVLIVEDDPMVAEIHRNFVSTLDGFRVVGLIGDGRKALDFIKKNPVRLVILDVFLPGLGGVELLRSIRSGGKNVDVIVVSAARNLGIVNKVMQAGAFDYIVKPFVFERIRESLQSFRDLNGRVAENDGEMDQQDIDRFISSRNRKHICSGLPKGLNPGILEKVEVFLGESDGAVSSEEMAALLNVSRITARRYLEFMVSSGRVVMERSYQEVGRPVNRYSLLK